MIKKGFGIPLTILLVIFLFSTVVNAQSTRPQRKLPPLPESQVKDYSKEAEARFNDGMYKDVIEPYLRLLDYDSSNVEWNYNLGSAYLFSNVDKKEAYKYFTEVVGKKDAPKDLLFRLGQSLMIAGLYNEAIDSFNRYKEENTGKKADPEMDVDLHLSWCENAKEIIRDPVNVKFLNLGKSVNSQYPDYAPVAMAVDTIVYFTSNRQGNMGGIVDGLGEIVSDVYFSTRTAGNWYRAKNLGYNVNFEGYDIATGISSNGDKLLVYKEGMGINGDIYLSTQRYKTWQKAELFDEDFDTRDFEVGACISPDGKTIYFAAEGKDSRGGLDIYMRVQDSTKKWSDPVNLGPEVNTPYDDTNPFIWHDGKTLFFASKGHNSMGGFDIFRTYSADPAAKWAAPQNLGYPLNTSDDNEYFTLCADGVNGFVSAVMEDGFGDLDIYQFRMDEPIPDMGDQVLLRGSVLASNGLPAKDAKCIVTKTSTGEVMSVMDVTGRLAEFFILLPPGKYELMARDPRAGNLQEEIVITGDEKDGVHNKTFTLIYRGRRN